MRKTKTVGTWNQLQCVALAIVAVSLPLYARTASPQDRLSDNKEDMEVFSGPQPGEQLPPLKLRVVIGDNAGRDVAIVSAAKGNPTFLVFMNEWNEQVAELMRVITLYAERRKKTELVKAVVWLTSEPSDLEARLKRARPHMPKSTPVGISLAGPEGPGAYGLNRHVQMTILIANDGVVTSNFALVQPSVNGDSVAVLRELVKVIGGKPPTLAEIISPRHQQIVATRIEMMVDESASDDNVQRLARNLESFVGSRRDAKLKLGQVSSEIVSSGRFKDRTKAIGYFRKWAKEYEAVSAQKAKTRKAATGAPSADAPSERLLAAIELRDIKIKLTPMGETVKRRIGWSPKGNKVPLKTKGNELFGAVRIGSLKQVKLKLSIEAKEGGDGVLHIDLNSDDRFSDEETVKVTPNVTRNKYWYSFKFAVELPFTKETTRPYPFSLWYVVDPREENPEQVIRWSRRGWHEGVFEFENQTCMAVISDRDSNGIFDERDAWGLGHTPAQAYSARNSTSPIGKHAWLDGIAFEVSDIDEHGQSITVRAFDLGISEEDDRKRNDPYRLDREYARAAKPVTFTKDLQAALATARNERKRVVVDFVTTWCGPCRVMDQLVYTAKPVVEKANEFVFVKLDGDDQRDLKDKYKVQRFPTLILLDSDGEMIRQSAGYQGVKEVLEFLK